MTKPAAEKQANLTANAIKILNLAVESLIVTGTPPLLLVPALAEVCIKAAARDPEHEQILLDSLVAILKAHTDAKRAGGVMNMAQAIFDSP
ncbi:MAG: hypothetical protein DLM68_17645 [Hyphomicrobiales bacterium]|nr:MAG: hypothetical protein DLM68_17645 [Hyphomicrobiales bacterium]